MPVHKTDPAAIGSGAPIEVYSLNERTRAVTDANNGNSNLSHVKKRQPSHRQAGRARGKLINSAWLGVVRRRPTGRPPRHESGMKRSFSLFSQPRKPSDKGFLLKKRVRPERHHRMRLRPIVLLLFVAAGSHSQIAAKTYTIEEAVAFADAHNPEIAIARKKIQAARGGLIEARSGYLPSVVSTGLLREREHQTDSRLRNEDYSASLRIVQNLYTGGAVTSQLAIGRLKLDKQELEFKAIANRVTMDVRVAFNEFLLNRAKVRVHEQSVGVLQEEFKTQQERLTAGLVGQLNVRRAEVALANEQTELIDAQTQLNNSNLRLSELLGADANPATAKSSLEIAGQLQYQPLHPDLSECLARADNARPEIQASQIDVEIEAQQEILDRSETRPQLEAFSGYEVYNERDPLIGPEFNHGYVVGLNARWHVFDGFATRGKLQATRARREAATNTLAAMRRTVGSEVRSAFLDLQQADRVLLSETKNVQTADESLEIAKGNLGAGFGTQLDILQAAADVTRTRTTRLSAIFLHNAAAARLARACATSQNELGFSPKTAADKAAEKRNGPAAAEMARPPKKLSRR
jgi:outer membrane protein TolC